MQPAVWEIDRDRVGADILTAIGFIPLDSLSSARYLPEGAHSSMRTRPRERQRDRERERGVVYQVTAKS